MCHSFHKSISLNVNVTAQLKLELAYYDVIHIYQPIRSGKIWHKVNF